MNTHEIELEIDGIGVPATVTYTAEWYRGWKSPMIDGWLQREPDEPAHWQIEIQSVVICKTEIDLLPVLEEHEPWIIEMEAELAENLNQYIEGKLESAAEAKIEQMKERGLL